MRSRDRRDVIINSIIIISSSRRQQPTDDAEEAGWLCWVLQHAHVHRQSGMTEMDDACLTSARRPQPLDGRKHYDEQNNDNFGTSLFTEFSSIQQL